jgi:hypothetical protein
MRVAKGFRLLIFLNNLMQNNVAVAQLKTDVALIFFNG